jgi:hypothetical protein
MTELVVPDTATVVSRAAPVLRGTAREGRAVAQAEEMVGVAR